MQRIEWDTMRGAAPETPSALPDIPVIALGREGVVGLARRESARLDALLRLARRQYTPPLLALLDRLSHRWLKRARNPFLGEMEAIAHGRGRTGIYALNLSYEWACTSGVGPDPEAEGSRLVHTFDWIQHGLGRHVVVAMADGAAGLWLSLTWPGFVGALTALAPGRFAAAINQPPLERRLGVLPIDWTISHLATARTTALPPSHLLRQVFDTAKSFAEAKEWLRTEAVATPAIFALTGVGSGEAVVIERLGRRACVHEGPIACANHWLTKGLGRGSRGIDSAGRERVMSRFLSAPARDLSFLEPPIVNRYTRLACLANAATGELVVQGFEATGPATAVLRLAAASSGDGPNARPLQAE
jgi:hypothetical protein